MNKRECVCVCGYAVNRFMRRGQKVVLPCVCSALSTHLVFANGCVHWTGRLNKCTVAGKR